MSPIGTYCQSRLCRRLDILTNLKTVLCPVWMAPALQVLFWCLVHCQMQSCVRPVDAAHSTAGPPSRRCKHRLPGSGWFPPTKSHSTYQTACVQDKTRGVLVLGLTIFPSLHWSCNLNFVSTVVIWFSRCKVRCGLERPRLCARFCWPWQPLLPCRVYEPGYP
jgi:hypothetical protein